MDEPTDESDRGLFRLFSLRHKGVIERKPRKYGYVACQLHAKKDYKQKITGKFSIIKSNCVESERILYYILSSIRCYLFHA